MKKSTKIISTALAALTVASTMAVAATSVSAASLKKPTKVKAANLEKSIKITWAKVKGAKKYKVYRGNKVVKTTAKASFKDLSVVAGKKYTYKVKAVNGKKTSKASKAVTITRMNYTIIKTVTNNDGSVSLTWTKRSGANQYKLYRKTSGKYSLLKKVTATSYTDKSVVSDTKYTYKVVCYNTKTKTKSQDSTPKAITYLDKVTGVYARESVDAKSVAVKWNAVKGAASYNVYRIKAGDSAYTKLASTTSTSYTDTKVSGNPTAYMYKIDAVKNTSAAVSSDARIAAFLPKRDGVNSYYLDDKKNLHVIVKLNKGDVYKEGKALSDFYSLAGLYDEKVIAGEDAITLADSVITAKASGKATVQITLSDTAVNLLKTIDNTGLSNLYNKYGSKTAFVEVEVA